jgi:hypothetical protein
MPEKKIWSLGFETTLEAKTNQPFLLKNNLLPLALSSARMPKL